MKYFFILILVLAVLFKAMPGSPPNTSKTYHDGNYGILVSAEQDTYLEVESKYLDECGCHSKNLYYTKIGGWFQPTKRILMLSAKNVSSSDRMQFRKENNNPLSPVKIYIASDPSEKYFYTFTPSSTFEQARFIKPVIIK